MSYRTIVVHVDARRACRHRLRAALDVAERHEALLIGIGIAPGFTATIPAELQAQYLAMCEADADEAKGLFERAVATTDLKVEYLARRGSPVEHLRHEVPYADLAIVGQPDPQDAKCTASALAEHLAIQVRAPVLVVPRTPEAVPMAAQNVLVAWNGSPESGRAVRDAIPFLSRATRVELVRVTDDPTESVHPPDLERLGAMLSRHGVRSSTRALAIEDSEGQTLLAHAGAVGADLIVMGAYGHSRMRELVLGGVTQAIIAHHQVPIFLSLARTCGFSPPVMTFSGCRSRFDLVARPVRSG